MFDLASKRERSASTTPMDIPLSGGALKFELMATLYGQDLAFIQAKGFGDLARGAAPEIVRLLRSASTPVKRVVDLGCGAGPLSAVLVEAGFEVTGIDVSDELLSIARACPSAGFIQASIYDLEIPKCEAILAAGELLTYHEADGAEGRVRSFFRRASETLPSGGMLIFDVIEMGEPSLAGRFWKTGEDWAVLSETEEDQSVRSLIRRIETFRRVGDLYRRGREVHRVRLFDTGEVCGWLETAGFNFTTAQSYGDFRLAQRRRAFFCTRR
jgi:SAM-dependent methyltransferase